MEIRNNAIVLEWKLYVVERFGTIPSIYMNVQCKQKKVWMKQHYIQSFTLSTYLF